MKDTFLLPYLPIISKRNKYVSKMESFITDNGKISLYDIADYHIFFGLHPLFADNLFLDKANTNKAKINKVNTVNNSSSDGWIFREWAPNATDIYIIGTMTQWKIDERFRLFRKELPSDKSISKFFEPNSFIWERTFPKESFKHGDLYRLKIFWNSKNGNTNKNGNISKNKDNIVNGDRIPTCATRVVQDSETLIFNAQVWNPEPENQYKWKKSAPCYNSSDLFIYEAHVGMAQEEGKVGSFREFEEKILPRIKDAGYNAIQLMAIQEHPYYGSFGYHVSNFFASSSRFGTPNDLKSLIDAAHSIEIKIIIDIVHSHAVCNEVEGLSRFDGTLTQFFHDGERGFHSLWGSRCFDYSKNMVIKFLLSNCRYWLEEFHVDGFRFDGITSMLYKDHGIDRSFTDYGDYFGNNGYVDLNALCYLYLANKLIHQMVPSAITIAEDVSGYPGLAAPQSTLESTLGIGFDYRFAMGIPDFWIKLLKECKDEEWSLGQLWYELNAKRDDEKTISYAECHDQALVGDQTLMMRLMGDEIYSAMSLNYETDRTVRGVALHKMIRLITLGTAGNGYLNFMGNEFGHPEWIDFPGPHNLWSFNFARRQWSLQDKSELYFSMLGKFDKDMIQLAKNYPFFGMEKAQLLHIHEENKVLAFINNTQNSKQKNTQNSKHQSKKKSKQKSKHQNLIFIFNFNPLISFENYFINAPPGKYIEVLNSDDIKYGGKGRLIANQEHFTHYISNNDNTFSISPSDLSNTSPSDLPNTSSSDLSNTSSYNLSNTSPSDLSNTSSSDLSNTSSYNLSNSQNVLSLYLPTRTAIVLISDIL